MTDKMLIKAEQIKPVDIFVQGKYLEILDFIKTESAIEKPDVSTGKGRALIKSMASQAASSKVLIEKAGKKLADDERDKIKEKLSSINESRNFIKDCLVYLKDEIREPLTKWEDEKEAIAAAEFAEQERLKQKAIDDERAVFEAEKKIVEEEKKKLEAERLQLEADERARVKVEEKQKETQHSILRKQADAEAETERLKQKVIDDEKQAKIDQDKAVETERKRVQDEADAKEKKRLEDERKVKDAEALKAADKTHRKKINNEALEDMNKTLSEKALDEVLDVSKTLIIAIAQGKIRNISINY